MISLVGSQPQTDDYRTLEEPNEGFRVFDAQHNIIFLIGGNTLGHQIKAAQILLTFLELHHDDVGLRCSTDIRITTLPAAIPARILPCPFSSREGTME